MELKNSFTDKFTGKKGKNTKKYYVNLIFAVFFSPIFFIPLYLFAQTPEPSKYPPLKYVSLLPNINDFYFYANGGFHADWYVGYNNAWIVKLPPVDTKGFSKAFIGAKLGRAKNISYPLASDLNPILGKVYIAISDQPNFTTDSSYFLVTTDEIPKEALPNDNIKGIDSAKWFWAYVPLSKISSTKPNYLAIWMQSEEFVSSSSAPIIAAGYSEDDEENAWLNHSIKGNPPSGENVLETPLYGVKPALAIKLIPPNEYKVIIKNFSAELEEENILVSFSVVGVDIQRAWLEISYDKFDWQKITNYIYSPPYILSVNRDEISSDLFYLRAAAQDNYENIGYSKEITIPRKTK